MYSMEAALDEERRMVLELLENAAEKKQQAQNPGRNESPHPASPRSPTRSLLNPMPTSPTGPRGPPRRSMLDVDTAPRPPRRSMLDFDEPAVKTPSSTTSPPPSIAESTATSPAPRTSSDSGRPNMDSGFRPIAAPVDYTSQYQFGGIITAKYGQDLPKRNTQGGKKTSSLLSEALSPTDSHPSALSQETRGRHQSSGPSIRPSNSKSPHRLAARSKSPRPGLLSHSASRASPTTDGVLVLDSGQSLSGKNAFQILSERNLVQSGVLPATAGRKSSAMLDGEGRLQKDYLSPDGEEVLTDSSDADEDISSDEENRGRKTTRRARDGSDYGHSSSPALARQPQSLLAAAEEERVHMSSAPKSYRSLLEPTITVTAPHGERYWSPHSRGTKVGSVHPDTSFDEGASGLATPVDSDTEEIKRAQNLSFSMTGIISQPESHRAVRIIYRGEYGRIQQQANEDQRRLRKYLVASDLSDESTHALEWAVGTVLRDGDTLVAICCIDEESGIVSGDTALVPDDPKAIKEQAAAIRDITASATGPAAMIATGAVSGELTASPAPSGRGTASAAEAEREKAVTVITDKITKLLRRTQLQVRVIVEVLHCKNPKHLITEVIDFVNPTLVILGSRGRSALKGVILGSFSNYLVTKSSVPVMVARKRLRKTSKYKRAPVRQVNNLETSTARLAAARID